MQHPAPASGHSVQHCLREPVAFGWRNAAECVVRVHDLEPAGDDSESVRRAPELDVRQSCVHDVRTRFGEELVGRVDAGSVFGRSSEGNRQATGAAPEVEDVVLVERRAGELAQDAERVPVVDEEGRLVGVLSRSVLQRRLAEDEEPPEGVQTEYQQQA